MLLCLALQVTSTFKGFRTPLGAKFMDPTMLSSAMAFLGQAREGDGYQYTMKFFSTLPDTFNNQVGWAH
jgi:hypothetical protein